ncbi:MAG TPA: ABC transporter permease [Bryobacteraceae bacterium]|nr:ABC transporter permease [Bryobacteraceae bacterium]
MNSTPREVLARIASFFRQGQRDSEFDREISSHLDLAIDDNLRSGMSPGEARRAALARFGSVANAHEIHRDARGLPRLESILQDVRVALRGFRRDLGFTIVAIVILALGIGANAAVFSIVNTILFRELPFRQPARLVWIVPRNATSLSSATYNVGAFEQYRRQNRSFEDITGYVAFFAFGSFKWTGQGEPERLAGVDILPNFIPTLGINLKHGRNFTSEESSRNGPRALILSYSLWQRRFQSNPNVVGTSITINGIATTIVGVMPESFDFSSTFSPGTRAEIFLPAITDAMRTWGNIFSFIGRLKPGVSIAQAGSEFDAVVAQANLRHPEWNNTYTAALSTLQEHVNGHVRRPLLLLWLSVGAVLLIVCTNLANLLLARASARTKETALRSALGAGRGRLIRQYLTESLLLSLAGAVLGITFAHAAIRSFAASPHLGIPLLNNLRLDGTALAFTAGIAAATGFLFGVLPALKLSASNLQDSLKEGARGTAGGDQGWLRSSLIVAEISLACVLIVAAGLLGRSLLSVLDVNPGFQPSRVAALRLDPPRNATPAQVQAFFDAAIRAAESVPGIERAAFTDALPLDRNRSNYLTAQGRVYRPGEDILAFLNVVSAGFVETMGIPLRAGRSFDRRDTGTSERVVIINETAARRHWPGQDPVGKVALSGKYEKLRVVGVVADVRNRGLEENAGGEYYRPITQHPTVGTPELVFRGRVSPAALAPSVRAALRELDPNMPAGDLRTLDALIDRATSPRRFFMTLLSAFAAMALLLASLGIYGVVSYSVNQRRREFGIRMALGASAGDVRGRVVRAALALSLAGVVIGAVVSLFASRLISALLFGVEPTDAATFAAMACALIAVSLVAAYVPALRASRVQPVEALRAE